ncbi:hypothetical protein D9M68_446350 [compost metagenome]
MAATDSRPWAAPTDRAKEFACADPGTPGSDVHIADGAHGAPHMTTPRPLARPGRSLHLG